MSPQDTKTKKPEMKWLKASPRAEEWMKVSARKSLWKKKPKPEAKKSDWPRRARPEAVLIKTNEGVSYAAILKDLESTSNLTNWVLQSMELGRYVLKKAEDG